MSPGLGLTLEVPAGREHVERTRRAVAHVATAAFQDADFADAVSMVAAELVDNALRHGDPGHSAHLELRQETSELLIEVTNRDAGDPARLATLAGRVEYLQRCEDAAEAYRQIVARLRGAGGGLGLARVRHEGACSLECEASAGGLVTVRARCRLPELPADPAVTP